MNNREIRYDLVKSFSMKCQIYPNKTQADLIDKAILGAKTFYNVTLYEILNMGICVTQSQDKRDPDKVVHWANLGDKNFGAASKEWKAKVKGEHPIVEFLPAGAITCKGGLLADMERALYPVDLEKKDGKSKKRSVEYINKLIDYEKSVKSDRLLTKKQKQEKLGGISVPHFYSRKEPRESYTYQADYGNISFSDNRKNLYVKLQKIDGKIKARGWREDIRFGENAEMDFIGYCKTVPKEKHVTVTIKKDNCGSYWIVFKLADVYVPMKKPDGYAVGVDVGIRSLVTLSDGTKYKNKRFKQEEKAHERRLQRQLARRWGPANEKFREAHKENSELRPSKGYEEVQIKLSKLGRKVERRRDNWNNKISREVVENHDYIAIETLSVKEMQINKYISRELGDAAMSDLLMKMKYKAEWHGREINQVGRFEATTKKCHNCGYIKNDLGGVESWRCPHCGVVHDADINAARNILESVLSKEVAV